MLKVIDQGSDDSVNAVNIKKLVADTTDVEVTDATEDATLIQSRHRIPERPLRADQVLVLQVPTRGWSCSTKSCASTPPPPGPTIPCS